MGFSPPLCCNDDRPRGDRPEGSPRYRSSRSRPEEEGGKELDVQIGLTLWKRNDPLERDRDRPRRMCVVNGFRKVRCQLGATG